MTDREQTCATCRHWRCGERERAAYAHRAVGTCAKGGPDPDSGCSDTGATETCQQWAGLSGPDGSPSTPRP